MTDKTWEVIGHAISHAIIEKKKSENATPQEIEEAVEYFIKECEMSKDKADLNQIILGYLKMYLPTEYVWRALVGEESEISKYGKVAQYYAFMNELIETFNEEDHALCKRICHGTMWDRYSPISKEQRIQLLDKHFNIDRRRLEWERNSLASLASQSPQVEGIPNE